MNALTTARAELAAEVGQKEAEVTKLKGRLAKLDDILKDDEPATTRKKPGPKPKAATAAPAPEGTPARKKPGPKPKGTPAPEGTPKVKGKPGPKPKADKAPKTETPKTAGSSRAAEGRRAVARGERPPIKQAMAQVMGKDTCNPEMVAERLAAKGWTPAAKEPKTYVGYLLSSSKDTFDRVPAKGRGFYKVKEVEAVEAAPALTVVTKPTVKAEKTAEPAEEKHMVASAPHKTNGAAKPSTDDVLKEAGFDISGPFGG